jgi:hypothetical protein
MNGLRKASVQIYREANISQYKTSTSGKILFPVKIQYLTNEFPFLLPLWEQTPAYYLFQSRFVFHKRKVFWWHNLHSYEPLM